MEETKKIVKCPKCGTEMNHHADKIIAEFTEEDLKYYNEAFEGHLSPKNKAIINLLPDRITNDTPDDLYLRLMRVIDFVSGMTDSFAVSLFRKLRGISLPGGRVTE